jgi:nucleotide-binding universal stress UspA family protein
LKTDLILCPIDFSDCSSLAVDFVGRLAEPNRTKVILLHVIQPGSDEDRPQSMASAWVKSARNKLNEQALLDRAIDVKFLVHRGNPSELIVKMANQERVDMVVMGTHGQSGWRKLMVGSVAQDVMRKAECPVVTVRPPVSH